MSECKWVSWAISQSSLDGETQARCVRALCDLGRFSEVQGLLRKWKVQTKDTWRVYQRSKEVCIDCNIMKAEYSACQDCPLDSLPVERTADDEFPSVNENIKTDFPPPTMVVDTLLPVGVTILGGKPKTMKSFTVIDMCISVAEGKPYLGKETSKGDVLYMCLEDQARRLHHRLLSMRGDQPLENNNLRVIHDAPRLGGGLEEKIERWVNQVAEPRLLVVDTYARIKRSGGYASSSSQYDRDYESVMPLKAIADVYDIGILLVTHLTKGTMEQVSDPTDLIHGTTGFFGAVDGAIVIYDHHGRRFMSGIHKDIEEYKSEIVWDADSMTYHRQDVDPVVGDTTGCREEILSLLSRAEGAITIKEFYNSLSFGSNKALVRQTLARLKKANMVAIASRGEYKLGSIPVTSVTRGSSV